MKLVLAIVSSEDSMSLIEHLNKSKYQVTKLATTGGFLKAGNTTLIIGVDDDKVDAVFKIIEEESSRRNEIITSNSSYDIGRFATFPIEVQVGGATVFVMDVEQFKKI